MFKEVPHKSEAKFDGLAPSNVPRKLTARDIALGIGRKATDEELEEYLSRPYGKVVSLKKGIEQIKAALNAKTAIKKKWK